MMSPATAKTADAAPNTKSPSANSPSKGPFVPSGNWTALQKTLPDQPSRKRKRSTPGKTSAAPSKLHASKFTQRLTTYNPWKPNTSDPRRNGNPALVQHTNSSDKFKAGRYVGIDCEMVGVGPDGTEDILARVSLVNFYGNVLLDVYVRPTQRITDWRTKHSGIRPADLLNNPDAKSFDVVQKQVMELVNDRILIGHALKGDFAVLKITHPRGDVRDTCLFERFREEYGSGKAPALKKIVQGELNVAIQLSEHDSVEDAQAAMALYRIIQEEYEKQFRIKRTKAEDRMEKKISKKVLKKNDTNA